MELNESARNLIGRGADAALITLNPDGSPHVSLVWVALQSSPGGDELVVGHLSKSGNKKVRNIRNDPRVAVMIVSPSGPGHPISLWLSVNGTARIVEGGAPELLTELSSSACSRCGIRSGGRTTRISDPHPHRQGRRRRAVDILRPRRYGPISVKARRRTSRGGA